MLDAVGRRVIVTGMAGSGKSTFSRALSARMRSTGHTSRSPLLEARMGEAVR